MNETVVHFLPQYQKLKDITIAKLVNQTSGIYDYDQSTGWWQRLSKNPSKIWSPEELLHIAQQYPDNFRPGKGWAYSNTNYVLLGLILEKVTGKSPSVLFKSLMSQMGLRQTHFLPHPYSKAIMKQMVQGYFENHQNMTRLNGSWLQTAGALVSRPQNTVRWMKAIVTASRY